MRAAFITLTLFVALLAACLGPPTPPEPPNPNSGLTGDYIGSQECFICHADVHGQWQASRHARAYTSIQELGEGGNTVCLNCHSTAYGQLGGFINLETTEALAGVGCESCHGPGRAHRFNPSDKSLRPPASMASEVCSACHNSFHHQTYGEWVPSRHSAVTPSVANSFTDGRSLNSCGACHSGDYRQEKFIEGNSSVSDSLLAGVPPASMNAVTCAVCHDPHANTGNAVSPPPGHDWQLRYPEVAFPEPSNSVAAATDPARFEGCGQCHHSRNSVWTDTNRGPHHSVQANFYVGEMPVPDGTPALVANDRSVHRFVPKQCTTCHLQEEPALVDIGVDDVHYSHAFRVQTLSGCVTSGCHQSEQAVSAEMTALQSQIQAGLDSIAARLGPPSTWEYSNEGGPPEAEQGAIPEQIKKVRYLYHYTLSDGSLGVHNPAYARRILLRADQLLGEINR